MRDLRCASWDCENNDLIQIYLAALIFVPYAVPAEVREFEVERKFDEFRRARLVITDRLHGMIFAAITGTPCIALNNSSGKVEGVWSLWLRHLDYVKFVREAAEIPALLDAMLALGGRRYDPSVFEKYWADIAATLRGNATGG